MKNDRLSSLGLMHILTEILKWTCTKQWRCSYLLRHEGQILDNFKKFLSSSSSSVYRVYSSLSVILQRDSQDKSPTGQYLQLKTGGNLIYTVRNWAGGKLPSVSLNSSTELAVVAADGRLFQSRMDLGKKEFR